MGLTSSTGFYTSTFRVHDRETASYKLDLYNNVVGSLLPETQTASTSEV